LLFFFIVIDTFTIVACSSFSDKVKFSVRWDYNVMY